VNVVLEGPDGGGKSTLAEILSRELRMRVQQGSGPPRAPGEVEARARSYLEMDGVIFDRHPCVSQPIYGRLRCEEITLELHQLCTQFYGMPDVRIYCRSTTIDRHRVKDGEDPRHVELLSREYKYLVAAYDEWAMQHAHVFYRIGDDVERLVAMIATVIP